MSETTRERIIDAAAERLQRTHWDGNGCGTHGASGCSRCFGPSPADAREVAADVLSVALPLIADGIAAAGPKPRRWLGSHDPRIATRATLDDLAALVRSWSS